MPVALHILAIGVSYRKETEPSTIKQLKYMPTKINLATIPELKDHSIITQRSEFESFLDKLRQDWYSRERIKEDTDGTEILNGLEPWVKSRKPGFVTFFAVYDEEDNHAKNDDWGYFDLFRCIAVRTCDGNVYLLKTLIKRFRH